MTLPLAAERWLTEMLLQLGPDAQVIEPADAQRRVRAAAQELLALYRRTEDSPGES